MKKLFKRVLLCTILLLTVLSGIKNVYAEDTDNIETYDGIQYRVNSKERWASVCGYVGKESDVTIPPMVGKGIIVSEIEDHAFDGCNTIKILTIPDTIMSIGETAFVGMNSLEAVISKTEGVNIVVRENVKIVSDRSELGNKIEETSKAEGETSSSNNSSSSAATKSTVEASASNPIEDIGAVDDGEVKASTAYQEKPTQASSESSTKVDGGSENASKATGVLSSSAADKSSSKTSSQAEAGTSKTENGTKKGEKPIALKILAVLVGVALVAAITTVIILFYKKKRR